MIRKVGHKEHAEHREESGSKKVSGGYEFTPMPTLHKAGIRKTKDIKAAEKTENVAIVLFNEHYYFKTLKHPKLRFGATDMSTMKTGTIPSKGVKAAKDTDKTVLKRWH